MIKYFIASDHAGFELKEKLKKYFSGKIDLVDLGPKYYDPLDDYNDFAIKVVKKINKNNKGILICGTGQGMSIQANRFPNIRCALCWDKRIAKQAKEHLNSNIISLPGLFIDFRTAKEIINTWINTKPLKNKKYLNRIKKLK